MRFTKVLRGIAVVSAVGLLTAACGGSLDEDSSATATPESTTEGEVAGGESEGATGILKIGFVSPQTGPLAGFGEADQFAIEQMEAFFAANPIQAGGMAYSVDIIVKDAQSDSKRAGEVAAELINTDGVDIVMAQGTPDIVNPVADQCEANATPCITSVAPWQPYFIGRGGVPGETSFNWTYHFFWGLEDVAGTYVDMWNQVDTNKKVGGLFPNDPDGEAWGANFPNLVGGDGYTINNPGLYPNGTQDFTSQISSYKSNKDEILTGVPIPPDFTTFWQQAKQQGYSPVIATIGKALLFPSSIEALGEIGNNLGTEVWWTPTYPFTSSLTGQTAEQWAQAYQESTGKQWTQPLGFAEALFEVAAAAVVAAGGTDKAAIAEAMKTLKVNTIVGDLDWSSGPVPNVAKTPLTGGQWRASSGGDYPFDLVIVSNALYPNIPTGGSVEPLK
jgi:branched-chain amino acid transport system substrate-binding protein